MLCTTYKISLFLFECGSTINALYCLHSLFPHKSSRLNPPRSGPGPGPGPLGVQVPHSGSPACDDDRP